MDIESYMNEIEMLFIYSPAILQYLIREKQYTYNEGYIRIKANLFNSDIFEAFEFVSMVRGKIDILSYRLQWQSSDAKLIKRWDNAEHHKEISTFPNHVHDGASNQVLESDAMSIQKALNIIGKQIGNHRQG
jgi:hypothetical protein